jgi:hypothetical protein
MAARRGRAWGMGWCFGWGALGAGRPAPLPDVAYHCSVLGSEIAVAHIESCCRLDHPRCRQK